MYLASALLACSNAPEITRRTITLHTPAACAAPADGYARYFARGDFQPTSASPAEDDIVLSKNGALLEHLPAASRSIVVDVTDAFESHWLGVGEVPDTGDVDVLLWPLSETCGLTTTIPAVVAPAFGALDARRAIISGGRPVSVSVIPSSFIVDLSTGRVSKMLSGPLIVRERASITPFGAGALLAGGFRSDDPNGIDASAEVWDAVKGDFDGARIELSRKRADHGAVALSSGDVLLAGGIGDTGAPIGAPEIVSLKDRRSKQSGLANLTPRVRPRLIRLASGEILVADGRDADGKPVPRLEILSPDASKAHPIDLVARALQSFVALDGGGALAVLARELSDPPDFKNVWRLSADGALTALGTLATPLTDVQLFPATGGGALLWTGAQWLAFDPWAERFTALTPSDGPIGAPLIAPASGLALWLDSDAGRLRISGRRFSIRNAFATELLPLAGLDRGPLAPDRSPVGAGMTFDPVRGLFLPSDTSVFVADGRYADFVLDAAVLEGAPPVVVLRDGLGGTYELGGADCPAAFSPSIHVERIGHAIGTGVSGALQVCPKPLLLDRVAVGLRGRGGSVQNIRLRRTVN